MNQTSDAVDDRKTQRQGACLASEFVALKLLSVGMDTGSFPLFALSEEILSMDLFLFGSGILLV
jgi:hypothetical protein